MILGKDPVEETDQRRNIGRVYFYIPTEKYLIMMVYEGILTKNDQIIMSFN